VFTVAGDATYATHPFAGVAGMCLLLQLLHVFTVAGVADMCL
jgi:hypothetical protein